MRSRISEVTRRDLWDLLSNVKWHGRLEEIDFLSRIYDLSSMQSSDSRFKDARGDIIQHRIANNDWPDEWVLHDDRFSLRRGSDETLLRFLCEVLHPVVRSSTAEARELGRQINELLAPDGYQLKEAGHLSGRPLFSASRIAVPAKAPAIEEPTPHFAVDIQPLVATLSRLSAIDGKPAEREVLTRAVARLEEPEHDNWNGGSYYYTLTLHVPVETFATLGSGVSEVEERIKGRIESILRAPDNHRITAVVIAPRLQREPSNQLSAIYPKPSHLWTPGHFRLFLSHVTSFKQRAAALRQSLFAYQVSAFVAHETIEPGARWQREIEAALGSMDAMVALLTPDFHASRWTDQEIGWALGRGVCVIPVRRECDPYGFIGEIQGIPGVGKTVSQVSDEIFSILLRHPLTRSRMCEAITTAFEQTGSFQQARATMDLLERASPIPGAFVLRLQEAAAGSDQIADAWGV